MNSMADSMKCRRRASSLTKRLNFPPPDSFQPPKLIETRTPSVYSINKVNDTLPNENKTEKLCKKTCLGHAEPWPFGRNRSWRPWLGQGPSWPDLRYGVTQSCREYVCKAQIQYDLDWRNRRLFGRKPSWWKCRPLCIRPNQPLIAISLVSSYRPQVTSPEAEFCVPMTFRRYWYPKLFNTGKKLKPK